ncbi:hypothetical protein [Aetokthonos hydrillicola]
MLNSPSTITPSLCDGKRCGSAERANTRALFSRENAWNVPVIL